MQLGIVIVFIAFFPVFIDCQPLNQVDSNGQKQGHWVIEQSFGDNLEIFFINNIPEGVFRTVDQYTGKVITEGNYKNGNLHGRYRKFYSNGKLSEEVVYKDGKKQGYLFWYHDNGKPLSKMYFRNDTLHGLVEGFNTKGKLLSRNRWTNGVQSDSFYRYGKNERLICIEIQHLKTKDEVFYITPLFVDENGRPDCLVNFRDCLPPEFKRADVDHLYRKNMFSGDTWLVGWKFIIKNGKDTKVYKMRLDKNGRLRDKKCPCMSVVDSKV